MNTTPTLHAIHLVTGTATRHQSNIVTADPRAALVEYAKGWASSWRGSVEVLDDSTVRVLNHDGDPVARLVIDDAADRRSPAVSSVVCDDHRGRRLVCLVGSDVRPLAVARNIANGYAAAVAPDGEVSVYAPEATVTVTDAAGAVVARFIVEG